MWHVYAYVPAVANVLVTDTFALLPPMSVGAPACCVKNTLCATEPKANVTTSPTFTVTVAGVNARDGVAATVLPGGGGGCGRAGRIRVLEWVGAGCAPVNGGRGLALFNRC